VVYQSPIGKADASGKDMLTADYRFHIGSIAKEFNGVGIMLLKEERNLSLDDKVSKYLPELPAWANKISILNLLQYTSGLPNIKWETVKSDADIMNDLKKLDTLLFEPGTNYYYNNNNVFLQRRIIERITGMPFNAFVKQQLLIPANMNYSVVDPMHLSNEIQAQLYKLNSPVKVSATIYGDLPGNYAFLHDGSCKFSTEI
jgi:CubicO group peptidase (beta-lactamase class C family)